jgi:hypothetical protein
VWVPITDGGRLRCVDAINTFRVIAGRFTLFRVVSRSQIQYFRGSRRFMRLVRFPAAPLRKRWSQHYRCYAGQRTSPKQGVTLTLL